MKADLKRIETTLHQLAEQSHAHGSLEGRSQKLGSEHSPFFSMRVSAMPAPRPQGKTPMLPKFKAPSFSNHRHAANPALAMNLLQEIEAIVAGWQQELQQLLRQIQDLYLEGPIVDGWLESHSREPEVGAAAVRHAKADRLMNYVEETYNQSDAKVTCESPRAGYRLCGLNADGQLWSRSCPPEQVPSVSMAIARYQKLRQLLNRKEYLETRLSQLAETLVVLHSHLQAEG
ncbi:MAG: hypothetical protein KME08_15380 [Aphanothece sp. CMT-3BRIN-NPC111]|jgi:type II secretory pathway component PulJ|nr:hypothetical protein [Aphanothece sp. CMT-3BRIN-NPC111]